MFNMISLNLIKIFFIIKLSSGLKFIDLKNNFISEGVDVTHGYFMMTGKYKMFHAQNPGLELIQYGHIRLFPDMDYKAGSHSLYVELFTIGDEKVISTYVFRILPTASNMVYKVYFEYSDFGYKLIDFGRFNELIRGKIHLSIDLSRNKNHPFFHIHTSVEPDASTVMIELRKNILGFRLRNVEAKRYEFGRIFDSEYDIYMGYSKISSFVTKATAIYIRKEPAKNYITLRHWTKNITFEFLTVNGTTLWNAEMEPEPNFLEDHHLRVYRIKDKLDCDKNIDVSATLDIAENLSPDLLGIEKVIGRNGSAAYTLFHHRVDREVTNKIKYVISSDLIEMSIAKIEDNAVYTKVEVITNSNRTFVIVTSLVKNDFVYETKIRYYDKPNMDNNSYLHIPEPYQTKYISDMFSRFPITIDFEINHPPSMVDHGEIRVNDQVIKFFSIKEGDQRGSIYTNKYIFGNIWENDRYEEGNIPHEGHKKNYKIIASYINYDRFLIKSKNSDLPILPPRFEAFLVLEK